MTPRPLCAKCFPQEVPADVWDQEEESYFCAKCANESLEARLMQREIEVWDGRRAV